MGKKEVKKLVLYQFNDYYNQDYIRQIINSLLDEISDQYDKDSNISEDIYCSAIISNKINYMLLNSNNDDDVLYMLDKSEKTYKIICDIKKRKNIPYEDDFDFVFDYVQKHYNGEKSYVLYFNEVIKNKSYLEIEYDLDKEKDEVVRLEKMKKLEKSLRLLS